MPIRHWEIRMCDREYLTGLPYVVRKGIRYRHNRRSRRFRFVRLFGITPAPISVWRVVLQPKRIVNRFYDTIQYPMWFSYPFIPCSHILQVRHYIRILLELLPFTGASAACFCRFKFRAKVIFIIVFMNCHNLFPEVLIRKFFPLIIIKGIIHLLNFLIRLRSGEFEQVVTYPLRFFRLFRIIIVVFSPSFSRLLIQFLVCLSE